MSILFSHTFNLNLEVLVLSKAFINMQKSGTPDFATSCSAYLMSPEEIRVKLRRLYVHYSCVGTRSKITKLTSAKLLRLLLDA